MTHVMLTFGHAAQAGEAPIEDALTTLARRLAAGLRPGTHEAEFCLIRAYQRIMAIAPHAADGRRWTALAAAELLIAADLAAALAISPTLARREKLRAVRDAFLSDPQRPVLADVRLTGDGPPDDAAAIRALSPDAFATDADALSAWEAALSRREPVALDGTGRIAEVLLVRETLFASYLDRTEGLPDDPDVSKAALVGLSWAAAFGHLVAMRGDLRKGATR